MDLDISDAIKLFGFVLIAVAFVLGFSLPLILINSLYLLRVCMFVVGFFICLSGFTVFGKNSKLRKEHVFDSLPKDTSFNFFTEESKQSYWIPEDLLFGDSFHRSKDESYDKPQEGL